MSLVSPQVLPELKINNRKTLHSTRHNIKTLKEIKDSSQQQAKAPTMVQTTETPCFKLYRSLFSKRMLVIEQSRPEVSK